MKIYKEIEIDIQELDMNDLFEELGERIGSVGCLMTDEYKKKLEPHIEEMKEKLEEIRMFLQNPEIHLNKIEHLNRINNLIKPI